MGTSFCRRAWHQKIQTLNTGDRPIPASIDKMKTYFGSLPPRTNLTGVARRVRSEATEKDSICLNETLDKITNNAANTVDAPTVHLMRTTTRAN